MNQKQKIRPLLCILNPREMEKPVEAFKQLRDIDKLYAKNMLQLEAYNRLRNYFLEHEEYTHLWLISDDAEVKQENIDKLRKAVESHSDMEVLCGVCNVDMEENKDKLAITRTEVHPVWARRGYDCVSVNEKKNEIIQVEWQGFPLTSISRRVIKEVPFRNDSSVNRNKFGQSYDVMFSWDCKQKGIKQYADLGNFFWHLKGQEGYKEFGVGKRTAKLFLERYQPEIQRNKIDVLYQRYASDFALVASIMVYEEEQDIEECLYSLQQIEDLDAVFVVDGRYTDDGYDNNNRSKDKTMEIVSKSKIGLFQKFPVAAQKWKSQAHKRNWTWKFIEKRTPADVWHLCIDADEEIVLPRGTRSLKLKPILADTRENMVLLESGPHTDNIRFPLEFYQPRLTRGNMGIHWHTGDVMVVHDQNCKILMDYGRGLLCQPYQWINNIQILNKWMLRHPDKVAGVQKYRKNRKLGGKCQYGKN